MHRTPDILKRNVQMSRYTRIGTGGPAALFGAALSLGQLSAIAAWCRSEHLPLQVLGKGSNVLASDAGFPGAVVQLGGELAHISLNQQDGSVTAGGGAPLMKLGLLLARVGYPGFTYMGVIPGSVGGAVRMNAGTSPAEAVQKDFLHAVALDPLSGETRTLQADDMAFGYRSSFLAQSPLIITQATFRLPHREKPAGAALAELQAHLCARHAAQPRGFRTFGSTFKNPEGAEHSAGWYLEQAGMKGLRAGGAMVAREHANWIINTGGAGSRDVLALINEGRARVRDTFGIHLHSEVVTIPKAFDT